MSREHERRASELLSKRLRVDFANTKYDMKPWGEADNWAPIGRDALLLLEMETSQKHPNTNVLKIWPYLEAFVDHNIVLVQVFLSDSPGLGSSRGRLAAWIADKMQDSLGDRFRYARLILNRDFTPSRGIEDVVKAVEAAAGRE